MIRKLPLLTNLFAISLLLFTVIYYGYYLYVGLLWGFGDRMLMLLVSDSLFLLLIPAAAGLILKKTWGWWLTVIIFIQLFLAKFVAIAANIFLLASGSIAEPLQGAHIFLELLYLLLYAAIVIVFSLKPVKELYGMDVPFSSWYWKAVLGAFGLYLIHFILTLIVITALSPV